jgi:hypothetical protein
MVKWKRTSKPSVERIKDIYGMQGAAGGPRVAPKPKLWRRPVIHCYCPRLLNLERSADVRPSAAHSQLLADISSSGQATESSRMRAFLRLFQELGQLYPDERMLMFSRWVTFSDLVDPALRQEFDIQSFKLDDRIGSSD